MSPVKPKEEAAKLANLQHISPRAAAAAALRSESGSVLICRRRSFSVGLVLVVPRTWGCLSIPISHPRRTSFLGSWGNTAEFGGCKYGPRGGGKFTFNSNNMAPAKPNHGSFPRGLIPCQLGVGPCRLFCLAKPGVRWLSFDMHYLPV